MKIKRYLIGLCGLLLAACGQQEIARPWESGSNSGDLQLQLSTKGLMNRYVVTSKGTDVKTSEEQEIKTLHVFLFDQTGAYLQAKEANRYQNYITGGRTVINIDRQGWKDNEKAKHATVIVVANVEDGTFSGIASDHSPCSYDEKYNEILGQKIENVFDVWGGISGIQSGFQVSFYEGYVKRGISPSVLANVMSKQPAKAFGIYGIKGDIRPGFDADLLIVDPEKEWEITGDSLLYVNKISAFTGMKGKGMPVMTIVRGQVIAEDGKIVGAKGYGRLVKKIKR